ncbi:hypothetical protein K402DRAFT_404930 [Aulographum hederae CBS 113979]|uniref:Uncharacterized protein n=1 Tax=Aulographum hederae CBS 113979 TaxID=1176131 RepID=A0A6G1GYK2_9PEZI|nr:hypothetical protein K402DRAFT_404930 [Aulographum hederae CBS 113979]
MKYCDSFGTYWRGWDRALIQYREKKFPPSFKSFTWSPVSSRLRLVISANTTCRLPQLRHLLDALQRPARNLGDQIGQTDVQEEFSKYKIWAGNVGAAHTGKRYEISLDYRLREASFLAHQVVKLLKTLSEKLENASSLVRGRRTPFEEYVGQSEEVTSSSSPSEANEEEEDAQSSPWDISSSSSDSNGTHGEKEPAVGFDSTSGRIAKLLQLRSHELPRLLASIKFTISCLYRIPIRKPAPFDRFKDDDARLEWSSYQHFDVLYVTDKFPRLDPDVAIRLGKMITRRRQLLHYRQTHNKRLQPARVEIASVSKLSETGTMIVPPKAEQGSQIMASQMASSHFTSHSKATTFESGLYLSRPTQETINPMDLFTPSIADSEMSVASSFAGKELRIKIPPRPTNDNGAELNHFVCPYCLISKQIPSERSMFWKTFNPMSARTRIATLATIYLTADKSGTSTKANVTG